MQPLISLLCSGIRTSNWIKIYKTLEKNKTKFEIIFVGSKKPTFKLNKNIKYIFSTVKPTQCWEIALRNSQGKFVMFIADDIFFENEHLLDKLYFQITNNDKKLILSPSLLLNGKKHNINENRHLFGNYFSPILPFLIFTKKAYIKEVGGIDSRFIAVRWDIDLVLRLYKFGCELKYCDDLEINENLIYSGSSTLNLDYVKKDDRSLQSKWFFESETEYTNISENRDFIDKDIELISQGQAGRWTNQNKFYILFITSEYFFKLNIILRKILKLFKMILPKPFKIVIKKFYDR